MRYWIGFLVAVMAGAGTWAEEVAPKGKGAATRPVVDAIPNTSVTIPMVQVPGGQITLKDEKGKEKVHEIKPFLIGQYEVRWDEWDVMYFGLNLEKDFPEPRDREKALRAQVDSVLAPSPKPYMPPDRGFGHSGSPMMGYTLQTAKRYVEWLSKATGKKYRLPTEAEWEWACRAGGPAVKLKGKELTAVAWVDENSEERTHRVGEKKPNAWGLYDMLGNVAEFVIRDGEETKMIVAGGSFKDSAAEVSSDSREPYHANWQRLDMQEPKSEVSLDSGTHVGFRLVRDVEGEEKK